MIVLAVIKLLAVIVLLVGAGLAGGGLAMLILRFRR